MHSSLIKNHCRLLLCSLLIILCACGPAKPSWKAQGKWIDLFAEVQRCDSDVLWEIGLNLVQSDFSVKGSTYLLTANSEGGLTEIPGQFTGQLSDETLTGVAIYTQDEIKLELNFDLTHKAETLSGSFTTTRFSKCIDGSNDRISGDVVFITEALAPVEADNLRA